MAFYDRWRINYYPYLHVSGSEPSFSCCFFHSENFFAWIGARIHTTAGALSYVCSLPLAPPPDSGYSLTIFYFFAELRNGKKYTSIFVHFWGLKAKIRAPEKSIDRAEALFCLILPIFAQNAEKTPFAVVDKRRFYYGGESGIRTLGALWAHSISRTFANPDFGGW